MRPSDEQLALLQRWERFAFRFADRINRDDSFAKRASSYFLNTVSLRWVWPCVRNLVVVEGLEKMKALDPPGGLLLVSNHRSFFDMYIVSCVLFRETTLMQRVYFPVRADYFYTAPSGLLINGLMSAWSMYPPVLRQPERSDFNRYAMARLGELLARKGTVVGFHPEGTRNKTDDPYTLLPAHPGVGQLIMHARPTVVPIFVHGMGNHLAAQVRSNFDRTGKKIIVIFGDPLDLTPFYAKSARLRTYMEISHHVRDTITALGARERVLRAELEPQDGDVQSDRMRAPKADTMSGPRRDHAQDSARAASGDDHRGGGHR